MRGFKRKYTNGEITVYWDPALCIHAMNCIDTLPEVFRPGLAPWINMEAASTDQIRDGVETCPTGAISWRWNKDIEKDENINDKDLKKQSSDIKQNPSDI